jgi:hypothetical protein
MRGPVGVFWGCLGSWSRWATGSMQFWMEVVGHCALRNLRIMRVFVRFQVLNIFVALDDVNDDGGGGGGRRRRRVMLPRPSPCVLGVLHCTSPHFTESSPHNTLAPSPPINPHYAPYSAATSGHALIGQPPI